jgi:hypothetical protein
LRESSCEGRPANSILYLLIGRKRKNWPKSINRNHEKPYRAGRKLKTKTRRAAESQQQSHRKPGDP